MFDNSPLGVSSLVTQTADWEWAAGATVGAVQAP